jgi:general L-amino acid transport system permease protein
VAALLNPVPETVTIEQDDEMITLPLAEAQEQELLTPVEEAFYSSRMITAVPPERRGLRYEAGTTFTGPYLALLLGLVIYTSAFIAEIVRAGIQAVDKGQIEAARALGFPRPKTLRLVILPQALRIIIPPMGNQYLNLAKNSSLAIAISYTDVFQVSNTIINQTGQTVTVFTMVMATYLAISLAISFVMNQFNSRFQLVTR